MEMVSCQDYENNFTDNDLEQIMSPCDNRNDDVTMIMIKKVT